MSEKDEKAIKVAVKLAVVGALAYRLGLFDGVISRVKPKATAVAKLAAKEVSACWSRLGEKS